MVGAPPKRFLSAHQIVSLVGHLVVAPFVETVSAKLATARTTALAPAMVLTAEAVQIRGTTAAPMDVTIRNAIPTV